jgi:hypothetical protein
MMLEVLLPIGSLRSFKMASRYAITQGLNSDTHLPTLISSNRFQICVFFSLLIGKTKRTASASFIACMDRTIVMDEWISSFSRDHSEFCTASGNAESGQGSIQRKIIGVLSSFLVLRSNFVCQHTNRKQNV